METKGDKVYLKAKPQFYKPAGSAISGFYRNGAVPNDTIVNDRITDNYNDCTYLGEMLNVQGKNYLFVRLNFTYRKHSGFLGLGSDVKSAEDLWFSREEVSFEYIQTEADIKTAQKEVLKAQVLAGTNMSLTAAGDTPDKSGNGLLIAAIVAGLGLLGGVLWWILGRKNTLPGSAAAPLIIQLPKPQK